MDQSRAPIMEALENFKDMRIVPFDVPWPQSADAAHRN